MTSAGWRRSSTGLTVTGRSRSFSAWPFYAVTEEAPDSDERKALFGVYRQLGKTMILGLGFGMALSSSRRTASRRRSTFLNDG